MGIKFFKPEDFQLIPGFKLTFHIGRSICDTANKALYDRGLLAYGCKTPSDIWEFSNEIKNPDTHKALIINIEELPKKEFDQIRRLLRFWEEGSE